MDLYGKFLIRLEAMDLRQYKKDFPIFKNIPGLVYLDSTATSLKPNSVIEKLTEYYTSYSANVFRGVYKISEKATEEYEGTRKIVAEFINAKRPEEIIFTRSTTESLNLVAYSLGRKIIGEGDEVVTTLMEHHSNFVTWQQLALENGATFKVIDVADDGLLDIDFANLDKIITSKTKILALTYISNVLGTINPLKKIIAAAKKINPHVIVVIDAAQAVPHIKVDVQDLGCDFLTFSSHKMLGPTGIGLLWGKYELLDEMFPFNYGGEMIQEVHLDKTVFKGPPHKFEAGTPHIAGAIALKEAIFYIRKVGQNNIREHEKKLLQYAILKLRSTFGKNISLLGPTDIENKGGIIAFTLKNYHAHDIAQILDEENICIRAGHHCAMPLHEKMGITASARMSFYLYNTNEDVDRVVRGLKKVENVLK